MFRILALLPILAVAAHTGNPGRFNLARQTTAADCTAPCQTLSNSLSSAATGGLAAICTNDILNNYGACYGCQVKSAGLPQVGAQQVIDAYTKNCDDTGHSISSLTIAADGSTTGGAAGGAAPAASGSSPAPTGASSASSPTGGNPSTAGKTGGALRTSASTLVAASALVFLSFGMVL
ncbi:hypothetical protein C8F04DRAFT_1274257 [Mycena alexandri]|uniref:Uncharacterized protein n=1 Tax=Mycena alexandri TaxID=1745969 RepID=A0AAD6S4F0_9AGAR|nr:hypothetical protein C8F04DRAFT_1274257 [Mycena alexandri]